ncbi:MAG: reverse transcriptase [Rhodovulum sp.]|nr:reverse transcriptase [Rhodovulum sp.]|tara:strand:+ start:3088 stop:4434 length:1347 start_codon:yes stop_codon:yes gene_type:complete
MLDQSFSAENFRKIFDIENRKGNYLEGEFFPEVESKSQEVQACIGELRILRSEKDKHTPEDYEAIRVSLSDKLETLRKEREEMLHAKLEEVSSNVCAKDFSFGIQEVDIGKPKKVFVAERSAETHFALKQVQHNIRRLYKVKQSNRHEIICQLRELLADAMPKYIVRTDISSFYESIPRNILLGKLRNDPLLTLQSKKIIRRILYEYGQITGLDAGLPRGIGISAYLAELYMRDIDSSIRNHPGVLYYARYVDDIVIIFCPPPNVGTRRFRQLVVRSLRRLGLSRNRTKTQILQVDSKKPYKLTYLGYKFDVSPKAVHLKMSPEKLSRYKKRLDLTFDAYSKNSKKSELTARRLLERRLRFLTGNTRLVNNKKNVVSGIFFSNPLLSAKQDLDALDAYLQVKIAPFPAGRLKNRLENVSFKSGFETKRYHKFSAQNLFEIVEVWKNVS